MNREEFIKKLNKYNMLIGHDINGDIVIGIYKSKSMMRVLCTYCGEFLNDVAHKKLLNYALEMQMKQDSFNPLLVEWNKIRMMEGQSDKLMYQIKATKEMEEKCYSTKPKYIQEHLDTDIDWLEGQGLDRQEAEQFIRSLLNKESGLNE